MTIAGTRESLEAGGLTFDQSSVGVGGEVSVNRKFVGATSLKDPAHSEDHTSQQRWLGAGVHLLQTSRDA